MPLFKDIHHLLHWPVRVGEGHSLIFVQKSTCMWHCKGCGFRDLESPQGVQFDSSVSWMGCPLVWYQHIFLKNLVTWVYLVGLREPHPLFLWYVFPLAEFSGSAHELCGVAVYSSTLHPVRNELRSWKKVSCLKQASKMVSLLRGQCSKALAAPTQTCS